MQVSAASLAPDRPVRKATPSDNTERTARSGAVVETIFLSRPRRAQCSVWLTRRTIPQPQGVWATLYNDSNTCHPHMKYRRFPVDWSREEGNSMAIGRFQYGRPGTGTPYPQPSGIVYILTIKLRICLFRDHFFQ